MGSNLSSPHFIDNSLRIWRGKRGGRKKKIARSVSLYFDPIPPNDESTRGRTRVIIFLGWKSFIAIMCIYIYVYIRGKEELVNTNGRSFNFQVMQLLPGNNIYRRILNHGRHVHSALMHDTRWKYFDDVIGFPDKLHRPRIRSDRTWEPRVIIYFGRNDSCPHHSLNPRSSDRLDTVTIP